MSLDACREVRANGTNLGHKNPYGMNSASFLEKSMAETALVVQSNLSHNVPATIEAAKDRLTNLATLYLATEVAVRSQATLDAKRPRSEGLRCGKIAIRMRVSEGIRTLCPWGHNLFSIAIPLGKSIIYRGVFVLLIGWWGVIMGQLWPLAGTIMGTVGHSSQAHLYQAPSVLGVKPNLPP
jgi:hypothetical protein